jgi:hypothetical protein
VSPGQRAIGVERNSFRAWVDEQVSNVTMLPTPNEATILLSFCGSVPLVARVKIAQGVEVIGTVYIEYEMCLE